MSLDDTEITADEEMDGAEDTTSSGGKRLPEETWLEIEEQYALGLKKMDELSAEFGVSRQSMSRRFKKNKIKHAMRAGEVRAAVAGAAVGAVAAKAKGYAEKRSDWIEKTRVDAMNSLEFTAGLATKNVREALAAGASMASIDDNLKAIQRFQKVLVENFLTRLDITNADKVVDEASLPVLNLRDITEREIDAIQRNVDDSSDDEIVDPEDIEALAEKLPSA